MPIPDYERIMLPLLKFSGDKKEHSTREAIEYIYKLFKVSEGEKRRSIDNDRARARISWARTSLKEARLLESTRRGHFRITDRGLEVLKQNPYKIDVKYLEQFPEFRKLRAKRKARARASAFEQWKYIIAYILLGAIIIPVVYFIFGEGAGVGAAIVIIWILLVVLGIARR